VGLVVGAQQHRSGLGQDHRGGRADRRIQHAADREQVNDRAASGAQFPSDTDNQGDKQQVIAEHIGERTPAKQLRPQGPDPKQTHRIQQRIQPELACGQEQNAAQPTDQDGHERRDTGNPAEKRIGGIHAPPQRSAGPTICDPTTPSPMRRACSPVKDWLPAFV
jgi:hypothetical protein